jgi:hypothetical protein
MEIDKKALVVASSIIPLLLESSLELFFNDSIDEHVCEEMDMGTIQVARENFVYASRSQSVVRCTDDLKKSSSYDILLTHDHPNIFYETFRMTKAQFKELVGIMSPYLVEATEEMRFRYSVDTQVAICIHWLASSATVRQQELFFGVPFTTCWRIRVKVVKLLATKLAPKAIKWPRSKHECEKKGLKFAEKHMGMWGNVIGIINEL